MADVRPLLHLLEHHRSPLPYLTWKREEQTSRSDHRSQSLKLSDILRLSELELPPGRVKVVRHRDSRFDIEEILRTGWIETYQQYQGDAVFENCDILLSFIGEADNRSRFLGVFEVKGRRPARSVPPPAGLPNVDWVGGAKYWYDVRPRSELSDLQHRLVIGWSGRIWHRWLTEFDVLEIRPRGRVLQPFHDYSRVHLSYNQLMQLDASASAHRDWIASLSAVGGVYLIVSSATGAQYVGSAFGADGIWGRWCGYLGNGHGGNKLLRALCESDEKHPNALSFSILDTFSTSMGKEEAIALENLYKSKLGSRAFGLNAN